MCLLGARQPTPPSLRGPNLLASNWIGDADETTGMPGKDRITIEHVVGSDSANTGQLRGDPHLEPGPQPSRGLQHDGDAHATDWTYRANQGVDPKEAGFVVKEQTLV